MTFDIWSAVEDCLPGQIEADHEQVQVAGSAADRTSTTGWEANSSNPIGRGWQSLQHVLGGL